MNNLWIYLSFLACLLTAGKVFLLNIINSIDCDKFTIISLIFTIIGIFGFSWLLLNKPTLLKQNFDNKLILIIILAAIITFTTTFLVMFILKITPNVSYSHSIINLNIIITILTSYFVFKQKINLYSLLGMLLSLTGITIMILYSNK